MALVRHFPYRVNRAVHHIGIVAQATNHGVGARATIQAVVTVAAIQIVVTTQARQRIVACQTIDGVGDVRACEDIVVRSAGDSGHGCSPFPLISNYLRRQGGE